MPADRHRLHSRCGLLQRDLHEPRRSHFRVPVKTCRRRRATASDRGAEPQAVLDELSNEIDRLNKENAALRQRVQLLTHRLFE